MAITRFDPFREFATLQDRMNRLFGDVYLRDEDAIQRGSWVPPVDIYETEGHDLVHQGRTAGHDARGHRGDRREQHARR